MLTIPRYFHPVHVGQDGGHQDGALHNPNPTEIAIEETNTISDARRDLIVSIGTGLAPPLDRHSSKSYLCRMLRTCSGLRLLRCVRRAVSEAWDAEQVHQSVLRWLAALDAHSVERYYRLNLLMPDGLPPLDDVSCMESLMEDVNRCSDVQYLPDIKAALLASCFFFELDGLPTYGDEGRYACSGTIRVRGNPTHVMQLAQTVDLGLIQFVKGNETLGHLQPRDAVCRMCKKFHQPVHFSVPDLEGSTVISLRLRRGATHRISGFPQTMNWFIAKQSLDYPFSLDIAPSASALCHSSPVIRPLEIRKRRTERRTRSATSKRRRTGSEQQTWI